MYKNVASQKIALVAYDYSTGALKTGDAANITAYVSKDFGTVTVLTDTSATEADATNAKGVYWFDVSQAESNADDLLFTAKSSTANVQIVPKQVYTVVPPPAYGTMQAGSTSTTAVLATSASATNDIYNFETIYILSGTGAGQSRYIADYVGSTRTATIDPAWATTPDNTSVYEVRAFGLEASDATTLPAAVADEVETRSLIVGTVNANAIGSSSIASGAYAAIADVVWDEATSGHVTAGTFGKLDADIRTDTNTTLPATLSTISGNVTSVKAKTDSLTFTASGHVDANIQRINDVAIIGDGSGTPFTV